MQISRYLDPELIRLDMDTSFEPEEEETEEELTLRMRFERKETLLAEFVRLLDSSGKICNPSKLLTDLVNRERKATTAIGKGIAIPHVRTMQARELVIGICRSEEGFDFDSPDNEPVRLFVPMAAPPYDDNLYLRIFKALAEVFRYDGFLERVMDAEYPYDVIRVFQDFE
ncbi:MAG: PTS sugar transporter subunit IIA [bacterium]